MRLSVFTGGCSLEAAEQVCSDDLIAADEVCDLLLHLVDKSLVVADVGGADEARFTQLQTLWQYGRERLAESKDADDATGTGTRTGSSSSPRMPARACAAAPVPSGEARIDADFDNLRAALDWFAEIDDAVGRTRARRRCGLVLVRPQRSARGDALARRRPRGQGRCVDRAPCNGRCLARVLRCPGLRSGDRS